MAQYYAQGDEGCRFPLCLLYAEPGTDWISMETAVLEAAANLRLSASTTGSVVDANLPAIVLGDKSTLVHEKCCPSGGQKVIVLVSIDEYRYERT